MQQFHVLVEDNGERIAIAANTNYRDDQAALISTVETALLIASERFREGLDRQQIICELHNVEMQTYRRISVRVEIVEET